MHSVHCHIILSVEGVVKVPIKMSCLDCGHYTLLPLQDGLTEEEKGPKLCSRPLINEQNCDYVLDTEPVVDSGKPG